ncbi:Sir2 histone deacetylase Hst2 [Elasticomyces elasticus]|uniref:NAD-dependent protein deacetylase n=1 Tax=Exophiala sideris TaxID=1016849 RepID=A0ABR0JFI0_9EURO|nr:Sir2 histone deacetylase Hst2 [Elasticomyces elasticus]KAK5025384.1 Sir2 histone deacetylase Hst2 [Exophiala sideris]KAK5032959.1 Sir2 histone deacetylase Hst2 [Exophiala sideris]KAK5063444.1 Sir2 histone deacetylase Hst2 [Exophiala sideris]KAK5180724.1 Sir2 histone deacetylase Hst2 [Eurotiomycetes sp. CCFEE 6388]
MGNESSTPVDEATPPTKLHGRSIEAVAQYMKEKDVKNIVVMTGAGISTSAGIPDFRSPDTGLYANLARLNLPYAEAVFDISYFRNNPYPFYTLAHELYPGKYRPTVTHSFISLLNKKGKLLHLFTQNIDCLEREAGVPGDKIVEAHGSFATQRCIECQTEYPDDRMREMISKKEVPKCIRKTCNGLVKPDIVFFGEALPEAFFRNRSLPAKADLAIVLGTSLTVQPFASLPSFVREDTPRVLINLERVGTLGSRPDDVLLLGDCDAGVRKFADALGWREELEALWETTDPDKSDRGKQQAPLKSRQEQLDDEIEKLTKDIDTSLKVTGETSERIKAELEKDTTTANKTSSPPADVLSIPQPTNSKDQPSLQHVFPHLKEGKEDKPEKPSL